MSTDHSTYFFYGVHVPKDRWTTAWASSEGGRLDKIIASLPVPSSVSLGHAGAGRYDRDMLFLVADRSDAETGITVELGQFRVVQTHTSARDRVDWDEWLRKLAEAAGYGELDEPGWIVVPDEY